MATYIPAVSLGQMHGYLQRIQPSPDLQKSPELRLQALEENMRISNDIRTLLLKHNPEWLYYKDSSTSTRGYDQFYQNHDTWSPST